MLASGRHDRRVGLDADMLDVKICRHSYRRMSHCPSHGGSEGGRRAKQLERGTSLGGYWISSCRTPMVVDSDPIVYGRRKRDGMVQAFFPFSLTLVRMMLM